MAVPQRKISKARKLKRRAHDAMRATQQIRCPRCNSPALPHRICEVCGHYRGKALIKIEEL